MIYRRSSIFGRYAIRFGNAVGGALRRFSITFLCFHIVGCVGADDRSLAERIGDAAYEAAAHPVTWGGLSAGLAFGVSGIDDDVSDFLADERPIFQETDAAADASDVLRNGLLIGMAASSVFAPLPDPENDRHAIGRRLSANVVAYGSNRLATDGLKDLFGRERPNEENDRSLPSGHTSTAFNAAASIDRNLAGLDMQPKADTAVRVGLYTAAGATAWARLEARKHFPSDVLVGAALGNFLARFAFGVIEGSADDVPMSVELEPRQMTVRFGRRF